MVILCLSHHHILHTWGQITRLFSSHVFRLKELYWRIFKETHLHFELIIDANIPDFKPMFYRDETFGVLERKRIYFACGKSINNLWSEWIPPFNGA